MREEVVVRVRTLDVDRVELLRPEGLDDKRGVRLEEAKPGLARRVMAFPRRITHNARLCVLQVQHVVLVVVLLQIALDHDVPGSGRRERVGVAKKHPGRSRVLPHLRRVVNGCVGREWRSARSHPQKSFRQRRNHLSPRLARNQWYVTAAGTEVGV